MFTIFCYIDASEHVSKNQKKRQRKAAKKLLEKLNEGTDKKLEAIVETRDPLSILKDKLIEAKKANVRFPFSLYSSKSTLRKCYLRANDKEYGSNMHKLVAFENHLLIKCMFVPCMLIATEYTCMHGQVVAHAVTVHIPTCHLAGYR